MKPMAVDGFVCMYALMDGLIDGCMHDLIYGCVSERSVCLCLSVRMYACMHACMCFRIYMRLNVYGLGIIYIYIHTSRGLYSVGSVRLS